MRERIYIAPLFFICVSFIFLIILFAKLQFLGFVSNTIQGIFFPIGTMMQFSPSRNITTLDKLKKENENLLLQLASKNALEADNKALHDQFLTLTLPTQKLLPVKIVGMPGVIPHISFPETYIINAGEKEGVVPGFAIIINNELIGTVVQSSSHFSSVRLVSAKETSFSVKTSHTSAVGVLKGQGNGQILMDNVLLSDTLISGDIVTSLGSQDESGHGIPPDLVIGKIISVEKNPSNLFQKAEIMPLVSLDTLQTVFVLKE